MASRWQPNPLMTDELGNDPAMRRAVLGIAIKVKRGIRPELPIGAHGGRRSKPFADRAYDEETGTGRRLGYRVGTRWRLAHLLEFGSVHNPPYAPLRRAAMKTGMPFRESPR